MDDRLLRAVELYAAKTGRTLGPQWAQGLTMREEVEGKDALDALARALDWPAPVRIEGRARPDQFPLLVHDPQTGWGVALQWAGEDALHFAGRKQAVDWREDLTFYQLDVPDPLRAQLPRAIDVFIGAIAKRKQVLVIAGLATIFANILTLATSLYAMQLYDRVIPLASFETLAVLSAGVVFALALDLTLRSLRAWLIELEAQNIDREVSEFFFARAQAIRLDARPRGVGTLAAQIQSQDQIRQVLSASSIFVLADLPFALFFLVVIGLIGGPLVIVPLISLPLALLVAVVLSRMIRKGADRAQLTGNRKNGLLVEMIDASESVKANLGMWQLLRRWNRLVEQIHHFERPIKRVSALSTSLFSALQQAAYVALMGYGAVLAATGELTTGALLACSIIAGRINGPLVAQLPQLIVQWGYARSSLKALDSILALPLEPAASRGALRPDALDGPIRVEGLEYGYDAQSAAIEIDALEIAPGDRLAVIGPVGAGKSTLLKLLAGLYTPRAGSITLAGIDLGHIAEDRLRRHIGYLPQNVRLIGGSLRDNLTLGLGDIDDETILKLARETRLDALISTHPDGLAAPIHEGGVGLSGGQRALVALNRLILARPRVWVLDEPTASLDLPSEAAAFAALEKAFRPDDIVIMATHRIQLLERFTRIAVLANRTIVRDAPAQQVLKEMRAGAAGAGAAGAAGSASGNQAASGAASSPRGFDPSGVSARIRKSGSP